MGNKIGSIHTFHDAITSIGNGTPMKIMDYETINIWFDISTAGTFTANFEGQVTYNGDWLPMTAANLSTIALATSASDATVAYQIDLIGWENIRVRISALSGTLSVYGRAVY